jgi:hypothetical protein
MFAFSLGSAAALLAWGPIHWEPGPVPAALGIVDLLGWEEAGWLAPLVLAAVSLFALSMRVQFSLARCQRRVSDVALPWRLLVWMAAARASLSVVQSCGVFDESPVTVECGVQICQVGLGIVLCWGLMAERLKTRLKSWTACLICAVLLGIATLWFWFSPGASGSPYSGDARVFILLQLMPVLVLVVNLLTYPEQRLSRVESLCLLVGYLISWVATDLSMRGHFSVISDTDLGRVGLSWLLSCALYLLAFMPVRLLLRSQKGQSLQSARAERRVMSPAWLHHFRFDALATPNRRHNS